MNNSPIITPEEWDRIRKYIADGPSFVRIETDDSGSTIAFNNPDGFSGMMHPRSYLQLMEDDEEFEETTVDILKNVSNASAPDALIGTMPGSLRGALVLPWKPKPPDTE